MHRRDFVRSLGAASSLALAAKECLLGDAAPEAAWRKFQITMRVEVLGPSGVTRIWLPSPLISVTPFQKPLSNSVDAKGGVSRMVEDRASSMGIVCAEFPAGVGPVVTVVSTVATRDYAVNLAGKSAATPTSGRAELRYFLQPTRMIPLDGIVKETATRITAGAATDLDKARAIYEWIVDNTFRNPKTRGCGVGNIRFMLESGDLGGKCADLNALYVGLARAAGLPARDAYGIRVAKSELGYKSLGASSEVITKAQHCRAEVYLTGYGWTPVDPADVRKVVLEEPPGNRPLDDEMVKQARARLFGSWEMNWMAYNFGGDVKLPGSSGSNLNFFMYPQAETSKGRVDSLDPDTFKYEIRAAEITGDVR
jgi:transglutaminase-like putative cysteine protease